MKMSGLARLGRDAEVRFTNDGTPVAGLALAVDWGKKDPNSGDRPTQWIEASFWGARAEALAQYLTKGSVHCFYLSDVHVETYQKNDGTQGVKLAARVDDIDLGPRVAGGQSQQQPRQQSGGNYQNARDGQAPSREQARDRQHAVANRRPPADFDEDSIPF